MTEEELLKKIARNDKAAFEEVFRLHYADLCKFCIKYVKDEVVAEEIVQEVFINIWDRRDTLTISTSVKAYLFTAVRNRSFNYLKLQLPKEQNKVDLENVGMFEVSMEGDDEGKQELIRQVQLAIDALPNKCKIIFNLSRNAGMTYKEIAEELDLSVKTVENQVGHALKKLRADLLPLWDKIMIVMAFFYEMI